MTTAHPRRFAALALTVLTHHDPRRLRLDDRDTLAVVRRVGRAGNPGREHGSRAARRPPSTSR